MSDTDLALKRLDVALERLERALDAHLLRASNPAVLRAEVSALSTDRARLAEELDAALGRERELQKLADEASDALGRAIEEVRAALAGTGADHGQG
jgi:hypothetical protein